MRKKLAALLVGAALMLSAGSAMATSISGSISFGGLDLLTGPSSPALPSNATGVTFPLAYVGSGTGDYSLITLGTNVTMSGFTFTPFTSPVNDLWSFTFGSPSKTYSFDLYTLTRTNVPANVLSLEGTGMLHISGLDATPGSWVFSTTDISGGTLPILTFSASSAAVPEPGTMVLLGAGLLSLAVYGKRRMNKEA